MGELWIDPYILRVDGQRKPPIHYDLFVALTGYPSIRCTSAELISVSPDKSSIHIQYNLSSNRGLRFLARLTHFTWRSISYWLLYVSIRRATISRACSTSWKCSIHKHSVFRVLKNRSITPLVWGSWTRAGELLRPFCPILNLTKAIYFLEIL